MQRSPTFSKPVRNPGSSCLRKAGERGRSVLQAGNRVNQKTTMDAIPYRRIMGHFGTGVAVVTSATSEGVPVGLTVNSIVSVSLDPALLLVSLDGGSASLPVVRRREAFAVSFLTKAQEELALRFASELPESRFKGVPLSRTPGGLPILSGALAWLECGLWREVEAGDHSLLIGEVLNGEENRGGDPLLFFRGQYGSFTP